MSFAEDPASEVLLDVVDAGRELTSLFCVQICRRKRVSDQVQTSFAAARATLPAVEALVAFELVPDKVELDPVETKMERSKYV